MAARTGLGVPERSPGTPGARRGRGAGTGEAGVRISPAQVRRAFAGSGCLEPGATRSGRALSRLSLESRVQCARGVARLSRGGCIPAGPGLALQRAACVPYHASSQRPRSPPSCVRTPGSPGGQGRCGGPTAFILRTWGWVFLGSAVGWCSVGGKAWDSGDWGPRSQQKALAPAILVVLHAAATSGHIAVLRT